MTEPTHLAAMYNAAEIILWVEDLVTSAYLGALWQNDRRIQIYIGGGHENLAAVVEYARRSGRRGVFSLRDCDFGSTNRPRWSSPDVFSFALETFEIECFLLDPPALAAWGYNTARRTEAAISEYFSERAAQLVWWMACRKVLAGLREARQERFPVHPKRTAVLTREAAEAILLENDWVKSTVPGLPARVDPARLRESLADAHAQYEREVQAGTWTAVFSGKELLEESLSWIWTRERPAGNTALEDLAKAVAAEQVRAGRAPAELMELRAALVARGAALRGAPSG